MSELSVTSVTLEELLNKLRNRDWLIPQFQREFVWSTSDVIALVQSILTARPIGMATLWEQPDDSGLELGPISLPDNLDDSDSIEFSSGANNPNKVFAVLDGLQRCTAIAMAFGGFRPRNKRFKLAGRYFLNVAEFEPTEQIVYKKESEVLREGLDNDATCISAGLFPLSSNDDEETILGQWLRYIQSIRDKSFYADGKLPNQKELNRRDTILKKAFEGITKTKLAIYIVPSSYSLPDICEIFERLNTTGTKVSTVDLIHSWLYADTYNDADGAIQLRDWIDEFGQLDGAIGWAASNERPELIVQMVTACYVAIEKKVPPRKIGGTSPKPISSVKAEDLLTTPPQHWKTMMNMSDLLAKYLGDFQRVVANGLFPWTECPYPVTSAIYVALRVHAHLDTNTKHLWGQDELNSLFRAFFWRNALVNRYDQGFLTQLGTDIKTLKSILESRKDLNSASEWARTADKELTNLIDRKLPSREELVDLLTDGRPGGASQKALLLPMYAQADGDLLDDDLQLAFPVSSDLIQFHYIYPKSWCKNNATGKLAKILDLKKSERNWVDSISNLMPLSRASNNKWKSRLPGQILIDKGVTYKSAENILATSYIDKTAFSLLIKGSGGIPDFWTQRAETIADDLLGRAKVKI